MITIKTDNVEHVIVPTIFPDGTSQVWKLPENVVEELNSNLDVTLVWNFENEREIMDLYSFRELYPEHNVSLHLPYLPYGRQDKAVSNESTFNLWVFGNMLEVLDLAEVSTIDAHNPNACESAIPRFRNITVTNIHDQLIKTTRPDYLVFPDIGARDRYYKSSMSHIPRVIFYKERDQSTGTIIGHTLSYRDAQGVTIQGADMGKIAKPGQTFLIIDDICDGGATFLSISKKLRSQVDGINICLFVTHGIFSKGRDILTTNGINRLYTTNSLIKNGDGFKV